jgi:hypothetical protein
MDGKEAVEGAALVLSALKFVRDILKSGDFRRKDKKRIQAEVDRLVVLAQVSDIEKEVNKKKHPGFVDYMTGEADKGRGYKHPATKVIKASRALKPVAKKKK